MRVHLLPRALRNPTATIGIKQRDPPRSPKSNRMASPTTSEQLEHSGASAPLQWVEEEELRRDAEVSSGGNGDGARTVANEDEVPEQGGAESSKASQELEKKKKGLPKG